MQVTQNSQMALAPVLLPGLDTLREIARLWAVRYVYDEDNYQTLYGVAWKGLMEPYNCWVPETALGPNSPADQERKYDIDVASRKILFRKKTKTGNLYWIHWEGNGDPWCERWGEDKVSIFAPDLANQMSSAPDFGVGKEVSWDEDMDVQEMFWDAEERRFPTSILGWVESISPGEGEANVPYEAKEGDTNVPSGVPSQASE
ncbi:hypothetical protein MMC31_003558 [Peltigera leucophlebia]|nr:hypothetical protein [Peltigera leucophlebia]